MWASRAPCHTTCGWESFSIPAQRRALTCFQGEARMLIDPTTFLLLQQQPSKTQPCPRQWLAKLPRCWGSCGAVKVMGGLPDSAHGAQHPQPGTCCISSGAALTDRQTPSDSSHLAEQPWEGIYPSQHPPTRQQPLHLVLSVPGPRSGARGALTCAKGARRGQSKPCTFAARARQAQGPATAATPGSFIAGSESRAGQAWEQAGAQHSDGQAGTVLRQLQSAS